MKSVTVSIVFPSICHGVMGMDAMNLVFWMLSFKLAFLLLSFTFIIKRLFYSSLSAIRVVSSAYLRLLIFLPAILTPACDSSSLTFHMMYSAYKLYKQGDNIQPWHTPFPILNESVVQCSVLLLLDLHNKYLTWHHPHTPLLANIASWLLNTPTLSLDLPNPWCRWEQCEKRWGKSDMIKALCLRVWQRE